MIRIRVARSASEMEALRPLWSALPGTIFQSFEWNRLAAAVFRSREEPFVVCCESDSGVAIIPAAVRLADRSLTLLGETLFDYRDVLHTGDAALLEAAWGVLGDCDLPFSVTAVRGEPAAERWPAFQPRLFCHACCLRRAEVSAEQFTARQPKLSRLLPRLLKQEAELRSYRGDKSALVRAIYRAKAAQFSGAPNNIFSDSRRIDFLAACLAAEPDRCEVFTLEFHSCLLAALITFRDGDWRRFYTVYYNRDWARWSPGTALIFEVTRRSLEAGLDCDYMTGQHAYKQRLASSEVPLYCMEATAGALASLAQRVFTPVAV